MDTIVLSGKRELDIYINPQRQNLLRSMKIAGVPMTAKQLSDKIGVSPSSVQHHLKKLIELGIVAQNHTERIHGITATYYKLLPKTISIGGLIDDGNRDQRIALMQADLSRTFSGFLAYGKSLAATPKSDRQYGDLLSGIVHLGREEAAELYAAIRAFLDAHEEGNAGDEAWEYAIIAYPVERTAHE